MYLVYLMYTCFGVLKNSVFVFDVFSAFSVCSVFALVYLVHLIHTLYLRLCIWCFYLVLWLSEFVSNTVAGIIQATPYMKYIEVR